MWKQYRETIYEVSDEGQVRNLITGHILSPWTKSGYKIVSLMSVTAHEPGKKQKNTFVHRMVAETFVPNPKQLPFVNHLDGNKGNNTPSNLEWCDNKHNCRWEVVRKAKEKGYQIKFFE